MKEMDKLDNDILIIQRAQMGDRAAYKSLYDTHAPKLFRFLRQFSRDVDEVDEWVQRSFIKAFDFLPRLTGSVRFSAWLIKIGVNEMKKDRRRAKIISFIPLEEEHHKADNNEIEHFDWNEMMFSWLEKLDNNKRMVFSLYEVEGYSHAEIAEILGIGESTSRTILTRTKQYLKERWNKEVKNL